MTCADSLGASAGPYIAELIGTFFLTLTIFTSSFWSGVEIPPLAIGSILMSQIFAFGHVSGGQFNPAVTLGVFLRGKIPLKDALIYVVVQVAGSLFAFLVALGMDMKITVTVAGTTTIVKQFCAHAASGTAFAIFPSLLAEFFYTFALVSVVLNVATTNSQANNSFFGLAIGFTVMAGAFAVGPVSGGAFNPAVGTALTIHNAICDGGTQVGSIWIYWLAPLLGGAAAAGVFRITSFKEFSNEDESLVSSGECALVPTDAE